VVTREARQATRLQGVASLRTESLQGRNQRHVADRFCAGGALKASPIGDHAFICGIRGKPLTKESFRNLVPQGRPGDGDRRKIRARLRSTPKHQLRSIIKASDRQACERN